MSISKRVIPEREEIGAGEARRERRRAWKKRAAALLGLYLEDFLALAGGLCFVAAAAVGLGCAAALATAGVCLTIYAVAVARAARKR